IRGAISTTSYTMYWNGGMRQVPYYHNMIGILTETARHSPTPRYYDPKNKPETIHGIRTDSSSIFYPYPWEGGWMRFHHAVDYNYTASIALLNYAADRCTDLLYGIYKMGRQAIEKGK